MTCVHVDGESSLVYSGSMDKTVKAWDMYTARCVRTYHAGGDWITGIHVRRDVVWTSSEDGCIRLWKAHPHLPPHADNLEAVAAQDINAHSTCVKMLLAPDRDCLLSGDAAGVVNYWHLALGMNKESCLQATAKTRVGIITCMALPYHERELEQWNMRRRPLRLTPTTRALPKPAHLQTAAQAGMAGRITAFVGGHMGVEMWALAPGASTRASALQHRFGGHRGPITCLTILDTRLFTGSEDATVRAWDTQSGECVNIYQGHLSSVRCLRVVGGGGGGDGGVMFSGACDLRMWNVDSAEVSVLSRRRVDTLAVAGRTPRSHTVALPPSGGGDGGGGSAHGKGKENEMSETECLLVASFDGYLSSFSSFLPLVVPRPSSSVFGTRPLALSHITRKSPPTNTSVEEPPNSVLVVVCE